MWTYRVEELDGTENVEDWVISKFVVSCDGRDHGEYYLVEDAKKFCKMMNDGPTIIWGQDRNDEHVVAHAYLGTHEMDPVLPVCARGWNRSGGSRFSIFRGIVTGGRCNVCFKKIGKPDIVPVFHVERKTKWV